MKEFGFGVSIILSVNLLRILKSFYILDNYIGASFTESEAYLCIKGMESAGIRIRFFFYPGFLPLFLHFLLFSNIGTCS